MEREKEKENVKGIIVILKKRQKSLALVHERERVQKNEGMKE